MSARAVPMMACEWRYVQLDSRHTRPWAVECAAYRVARDSCSEGGDGGDLCLNKLSAPTVDSAAEVDGVTSYI